MQQVLFFFNEADKCRNEYIDTDRGVCLMIKLSLVTEINHCGGEVNHYPVGYFLFFLCDRTYWIP